MRRKTTDNWILVVGALAILWIALTFLSTLVFIVDLIRTSAILVTTLLLCSFLAIVLIGYRLQADGEGFLDGVRRAARRAGERAGWLSLENVVVEGRVRYDGLRWPGRYLEEGTVAVDEPECPHCGLELVETHVDCGSGNHGGGPESSLDPEFSSWTDSATRSSSRVVDALACPQCVFWRKGDHESLATDAVESMFRAHFDRMRNVGSATFETWRVRASHRTGGKPAPADLWDEYVSETDDEAVCPIQVDTDVSKASSTVQGTYQALERIKNRAAGFDRIVEAAPEPFDLALARLVRTDYLARKADIRAVRGTVRSQFLTGTRTFRRNYGRSILRVLNEREERRLPQVDIEAAAVDLREAADALDALYNELDEAYVTDAERNQLRALERQVTRAQEFLVTVQSYDSYETAIQKRVKTFESRFAPYDRGNRYMTTADREFLQELGRQIHAETSATLEELSVELLPPERVDAMRSRRDEFADRLAEIPGYNEGFVAARREQYADVLTSEHGPLNESQQKAVVRNDRHNLVDASAGTGKTLTLTHRFLYLHRMGVPVDDIVALTLTNDAADEMSERIAAVLDTVDETDINVSTIHTFAQGIVQDAMVESIDRELLHTDDWDEANPSYRERLVQGFVDGEDWVVEEYADAYDSFREHHETCRQADDGQIDGSKQSGEFYRDFFVRKYADFIEKARDFALGPANIEGRLTKAKRQQYHFGRAGASILAAYQEAMETFESPLDFTDMVESAARIVAANPKTFQTEYRHILVDEFQDVARSDIELLQGFIGEHGDTRLFAVGDDWQSIFGFRGSNPRFFTGFEDIFDGVAYTQLTTNYRCPPDIVRAGTQLMENSTAEQNEKAVEAYKTDRANPRLHRIGYGYEGSQAAYVVGIVEQSREAHPDRSVMILSRNSDKSPYMARIRSLLDERGIPYNQDESDGATVTVQSIHASKGTEADHVVLVHAAELDHGLPSESKSDYFVGPAVANTADYYAEERRLCYVALTRTESELDVITRAGFESRYIAELEEWFDVRRVGDVTVEGEVVAIHDPETKNKPLKGTLDCGWFRVDFMAWPSWDTPKMERGDQIRVEQPMFEASRYGIELQLNPESSEISIQRASR